MSIELRTVGQLDTRRASYSTLTQGSGIGFVHVTKITFVTTEEHYSSLVLCKDLSSKHPA